MSPIRKAIVWGINLVHTKELPRYRMDPREAMIEPNRDYANRVGAVFFDHKWMVADEKRAWVPITGYLYIGRNVPDAPPGRNSTVSYRMVVEKILLLNELLSNSVEEKYIPYWRKQCKDGKWDDGSCHDKSPIWLKVSNICTLSKGYSPREMGIKADFVRRGVYIDDKGWT